MKHATLHLLFPLLLPLAAAAQLELKIQLQPDGKTHTVLARPQADWLPPLDNLTHSAQVTLTVPTGSLLLDDFQSLAGTWHLTSILQHPAENPGADYAVFKLVGSTSEITYAAGQEVALFSFKNQGVCAGAFEIMLPGDPFSPPNSLGAAAGCEFAIQGAGAGGNAFTGSYDPGSANCLLLANCLVVFELELLPNGFYEVSLTPDDAFLPPPSALASVQVALKVPAGFFKIHQLTNLQPGALTFGSVSRHDAPVEAPAFDYLLFRLNATDPQGFPLQAGVKMPLLKFANGGSCQGDSIFLVDNASDPFLPPNSQGANIGQHVVLAGAGSPYAGVCLGASWKAPCAGCLFTQDILKIDSVETAAPVACLGGQNGMARIFASGASSLEFTLDGGQSWQAGSYFNGLGAGTFHPAVRGSYFGCEVTTFGDSLELALGTVIMPHLDAPSKVCAGEDFQLKIIAPSPLPAGTAYSWTGPQGFSANIPDPAIFSANAFQSGTYLLAVSAPGCDPASASAFVQIVEPVEQPALLTNSPLCDGDTLRLWTATAGMLFEWLGPAGQAPATLALLGATTAEGVTFFEKNHPAQLPGEWRVRVTDANGCRVESAPASVAIKPRPQAFAENDGPVCLGEAAQLLANPVPGAEFRWRKAGQAGVFSQQQNPVLPAVTTQQTFALEVALNGCASQNVALTTVALNPKPAADPAFSYALAADCSPADLQFAANAAGLGNTFEWTGVSGFASQLENPVVPNASASHNGSYLLEVTNAFGCKISKPFGVSGVVDALPQPLVTGTPPVCPGGTVELSATQDWSGFPVAYQWYRNGNLLPNAVSSQLFLANAQPASEGKYRVRVQVDACVLLSAEYVVDLLDAPAATPAFSLSDVCEGGALQFFANTAGVASWHWAGPNGFASDAANPLIYSVQFADVGAYSLTTTALNGCSAAGSVVVDGILPVPAAPQVSANSPVCPEQGIVLQVQNPPSFGTVTFEWVNSAGVSLAGSAATLALAPGDPLALPPFLVKTMLNGCSSVFSEPVQVEVKPPPVAVAGSNGGGVCPGGEVQLFAAPVPDGSYEWRVAGSPAVVSFDQNPILILWDTTTYELRVKSGGCETEAADSTTAAPLPAPAIANLSGGGSFCEGTAVTLSAENSAPLGGSLQFTWTGPGGFFFTGSAAGDSAFSVVVSDNEGAYALVLESAEGCASAPQSVQVSFSEMPAPPALAVSSQVLCQGETLQLDASAYPGGSVEYQWFFHDGTAAYLLGSTSFPTFFLNAAMPSNSGAYYATATVDGCQSAPSNLEAVTVLGVATNLLAENSTTAAPACEGESVQLSAPFVAGATYDWYGPAGFHAEAPNPLITNVEENQAGSYLVVVGLPGCSSAVSSSTEVFINAAPDTPVLAGDGSVCEGEDALISVANAEAGAAYDFYFGQNLLASGAAASLLLDGVSPNEFGGYSAVARGASGCLSAVSDPFQLVVDVLPGNLADAGDDLTLCPGEAEILLAATPPSIGTGVWTALNGAALVNPGLPATLAAGLLPGENRFAWTLSNGACETYASDTASIFLLEKIEALPDVLSVPAGGNLLDINLLENDFLENTGSWEFQIFTKSEKGELTGDGDGTVSYQPYPNVFGFDEFIYRLCSATCPDACDTALVTLKLEGSGDPSDCFLPNLVTPNGDGENDTFIIPCAIEHPGSSLVIFNRWGSTLFETGNYASDWDGSHDGEPLPVGTYFFQLTLNDGRQTRLSGYVAVMR